MRKITKTILTRILWLGRGTAATMGVAIMLAVATIALAAVPGDPFKLGKTNTIGKLSTLVGSASGALLRINNEGSGPALDLRVEEDEAPRNVNSITRVNALNADRVDGKDSTAFVPAETYEVQKSTLGEGEGQGGTRSPIAIGEMCCWAGDSSPAPKTTRYPTNPSSPKSAAGSSALRTTAPGPYKWHTPSAPTFRR